MQLLIRSARVLDQNEPVFVWCDQGMIAGISPRASDVPKGSVDRTLDVDGRLLLPAFVNPHLHCDKSLLGDRLTLPGSSLEDAVRLTWDFKARASVESIMERATAALLECLSAGSTFVRAFADVDKIGGLKPVRALIEVARQLEGLVDVEVVAFPQEGLLRPEGDVGLLREAMGLGAQVVGGLPWYERSDEHVRQHVDAVMDLAQEFDSDVHVLADDTDDPTSRSLEYLALQTIERGWQGRVTASHCGALAAYDHTHADRVIELIREAELSICSNPHISLVMGGLRDRGLVRRGITRVAELLAAGVNVCSGQDDIDDPYYPFGRGDQLEVASFMSHVARLTTPQGLRTCLDMVTVNAAQAVRLPNYGLAVGRTADLVLLDGRSPREALRLQRPRPFVIKKGQVLVEHELRSILPRRPQTPSPATGQA
jgi:cytosine/creatinine deaminase